MSRGRRRTYVFCVEGAWTRDLRASGTLRPVLELLSSHSGIRYLYRTCLTREELFACVKKWTEKRYGAYKILYLGFHGDPGIIQTDNGEVTLDELAEHLNGKATNRIIYFGSCATLDLDRRNLTRFLRKSGALAVAGFLKDVNWLQAAAFEVLLLAAMQGRDFSGRWIRAIERRVHLTTGRLPKELGFRLEYLPYY